MGDNLRRFDAGMKCCGIDGSIPIVVPMRWNGDTPMIMMTETSLPRLGHSPSACSFTAIATTARGSTAPLAATCSAASKSARIRKAAASRDGGLAVERARSSLLAPKDVRSVDPPTGVQSPTRATRIR